MYGVLWSFFGASIIFAAIADAVWTTLTVSGAGILSARLAGLAGRASMKGPGWLAENAPILALCTSFLLWSLLLWAGWTMVFCGSALAVVDSTTLAPAGLIGRMYFAGFALTTLGVGDLQPGGGPWRIATVLAAANGFVVLTLFVTYTSSLISALNNRRSFAASVGQLAPSPEDIILLLRGGGEQALSTRLLNLTGQLEEAAMQTDAYPVLGYSLGSNARRSFDRAVVTLGEVALLLQHAVQAEDSLPAATWQPLRNAVNLMIGEKHRGNTSGRSASPGPPDLARLQRSGLRIDPAAERAFQDPAVQELRSHWGEWLRWHGHSWSALRDASEPS